MAIDVVAIGLASAYWILTIYVSWQIYVLFAGRHDPWHYKALFNYLTLVWMLFRAIFWSTFASNISIPRFMFYFLYYVPIALILNTFATLALFFIKIISYQNWYGQLRLRCIRYYYTVITLSTFTMILLSFFASFMPSAYNIVSITQLSISATLFLVLSVIFAFQSNLLLRHVPSSQWARLGLLNLKKLVPSVAILLAILFFIRAIFDILTACNVVVIDISQNTLLVNLELVGVYFLWEFFPLLLLLFTIATGAPSKSSIGGDSSNENQTGFLLLNDPMANSFNSNSVIQEQFNFGIFGAIHAMESLGSNEYISDYNDVYKPPVAPVVLKHHQPIDEMKMSLLNNRHDGSPDDDALASAAPAPSGGNSVDEAGAISHQSSLSQTQVQAIYGVVSPSGSRRSSLTSTPSFPGAAPGAGAAAKGGAHSAASASSHSSPARPNEPASLGATSSGGPSSPFGIFHRLRSVGNSLRGINSSSGGNPGSAQTPSNVQSEPSSSSPATSSSSASSSGTASQVDIGDVGLGGGARLSQLGWGALANKNKLTGIALQASAASPSSMGTSHVRVSSVNSFSPFLKPSSSPHLAASSPRTLQRDPSKMSSLNLRDN
jgi:hypothetical protein